jgi:leucyl/phenylalanyl-tRNA---protein transferase
LLNSTTDGHPDFTESWRAALRRRLLGVGYAVRPVRLGLLPRVLGLTARHWLKGPKARRELPVVPAVLDADGLIGICDDLSVPTLLRGYRLGLYPFCHIGPMKWWSPAERSVLFFDHERIEDSVRKLVRKRTYRLSFDRAFGEVMKACAQPRAGKVALTWITPSVMAAYYELHKAGYAHSIEVWDAEDRLVGGIYGVTIGDVFFGESQFSRASNTSKLASAVLNAHLRAWGFAFRDTRTMTDHHAKAGAVNVPRAEFNALVAQHASRPTRLAPWIMDETIELPRNPAVTHAAA